MTGATTTIFEAGQFRYTWTTTSLVGTRGFGLSGMSANLANRLPWVRAQLKDLEQFDRTADESADSLGRYRLVERRVVGPDALLISKTYQHKTGDNRTGNYCVQVLVAPKEVLTVSMAAAIAQEDFWIAPYSPVDITDKDLPMVRLPSERVAPPAGRGDVVVSMLRSLLDGGWQASWDSEDLMSETVKTTGDIGDGLRKDNTEASSAPFDVLVELVGVLPVAADVDTWFSIEVDGDAFAMTISVAADEAAHPVSAGVNPGVSPTDASDVAAVGVRVRDGDARWKELHQRLSVQQRLDAVRTLLIMYFPPQAGGREPDRGQAQRQVPTRKGNAKPGPGGTKAERATGIGGAALGGHQPKSGHQPKVGHNAKARSAGQSAHATKTFNIPVRGEPNEVERYLNGDGTALQTQMQFAADAGLALSVGLIEYLSARRLTLNCTSPASAWVSGLVVGHGESTVPADVLDRVMPLDAGQVRILATRVLSPATLRALSKSPAPDSRTRLAPESTAAPERIWATLRDISTRAQDWAQLMPTVAAGTGTDRPFIAVLTAAEPIDPELLFARLLPDALGLTEETADMIFGPYWPAFCQWYRLPEFYERLLPARHRRSSTWLTSLFARRGR